MGSRILRFSWTILQPEVFGAKLLFYDCDPHFHDTYTIGMVRRGLVRLSCGGGIFSAEPGDVFVVHPYEVHGGGDKLTPVECDILYPSIDMMANATGVASSDGKYPYFGSPVFKGCKSTTRLIDLVAEASAEGPSSCREPEVSDALRAVFRPYVQGIRRVAPVADEYPLVRISFETMLEKSESIECVADLADMLGVSHYRLCREFHRALGVPPSVILRQLRVAKARRLIATGEGLARAAASSGFYDQAHFTRAFKNVFGFPPGCLVRGLRHSTATEWAPSRWTR